MTTRRTALKSATLILIAVSGVAAAVIAITRTDDDPINTLLAEWPVVAAAGLLYLVGMCAYAGSWASLFESGDNRRLIGLGFLISQPVKYLPGGFAQPIGQVTLTAQAIGSTRRAVVAFPVHVLINVVTALTLGAPLLFSADVPSWAGWLVVLVPLFWAALNRRWMSSLLSLLGRVHRVFRVTSDIPAQSHINKGFAWALAAHGAMFASFGVLTASSVPSWSVLDLSVAYAIAWLVGYVALPAPAGLGAREAVLVVFLGSAVSTGDVVRISAVHRIATLVVELAILLIAVIMTRTLFSGAPDNGAHTGVEAHRDEIASTPNPDSTEP